MVQSQLVSVPDTALTIPEADALVRYEQMIERGFKTFVDVGMALAAIRDRQLYRAEHGTFEEYCKQRWGMSRPRAYQLIDTSHIVGNLSTIVDILPANEAQVRPLTILPPEQQPEAWQRAVETAPNGKITAAHVARVVEEIQRPPRFTEGLRSSATPEWYTPAPIIALVRQVLGSIDLDPCSCAEANATVQAVDYFGLDNDRDGLHESWYGARTVFMNPPYGDEIGKWVRRLIDAYEGGAGERGESIPVEIEEAIALLPARVDTQWWGLLSPYPVCFWTGRVRFSGSENSAPFPSAIVYLGERWEEFARVFGAYGRLYRPWEGAQ